MHMVLKL
ncbi:uncharacterized protein FFE2_14225 [Fusarium fujikuroi]|nr:uncharacterized protein FFE2_14225 [Fusarium fujikuroi]